MSSEEIGVDHPNPYPPKIDFSEVDPSVPGGPKWSSVREQVMGALTSAGCFEAVYPGVGAELRRALFGGAVRDVFDLPREAKLRNKFGPELPFHGYLGGLPYLDGYESLAIIYTERPDAVRSFADLMWPGGNPTFCETASDYAGKLAELEKMVRRMILESLGVLKYCEAQNESTWYLLRFAEYKAPHAEAKRMAYTSHQDTNTLSIVCQNQISGLEVQTKEGQWIPVEPNSETSSFIVMAGNALRAWTNGRVWAPYHRILVGGEETRYSVMLFSVPPENQLVQAPEELVDENHPALFKPYNYDEYVRFSVSEQDARTEDKLMALCGVTEIEVPPA